MYILLIIIVILVIIALCYYIFSSYYKIKLRAASWDTLQRNHPALEKLFRKYEHDTTFFGHIDELMQVQDINSFKAKVTEFTLLYPDFQEHMKSLKLSSSDTWIRFQNHWELAKTVFAALQN